MRRRRNLLLADADETFCQLLRSALEETGLFSVTWVEDGRKALAHALSAMPDILVTEVALPGLDGLSLLRTLQERRGSIPETLMISSFVSQSATAEAAALGASYFLPKPFTPAALADRLQRLPVSSAQTASPLRCAVAAALHALGVPAHLMGYRYLREAIVLTLQNETLLHGMTKVLYPLIARSAGATASQVERDIRRAIEASWGLAASEVVDRYFGPMPMAGRPSNGVYIAALTSRLITQLPSYVMDLDGSQP